MIQIKEITEERDWHPEKLLPDFPFQQSFWYGEMQKKRGREVKRIEIFVDGDLRAVAQFVAYPLLKNKKYWYAAYGPIVKDPDLRLLKDIQKECRAILGSEHAVFVRLDFSLALSDELAKDAAAIFTKASRSSSSGAYFQPRFEWYTDISKSDEEILAAMHKKSRYYVKYAEKRGVKTEIIDGKMLLVHLERFLALMKDTAKRNGFSLHDDEYYKYFFEEVANRGNGFLVEARIEDDLPGGDLAIHFFVVEGSVAHYVFGASSDDHKELCAPYLAHFRGMIEAKKRGAVEYNFGGVSDGDTDPDWQNITIFKKKFGGKILAHSKYFDIVLRPFWYYLYIARKLMKKFV